VNVVQLSSGKMVEVTFGMPLIREIRRSGFTGEGKSGKKKIASSHRGAGGNFQVRLTMGKS